MTINHGNRLSDLFLTTIFPTILSLFDVLILLFDVLTVSPYYTIVMMAATRLDELENAFDDHGSVAASLEDFEESERRSPLFAIPSQHSGFRSDVEESEIDDRSSMGAPWSPPGFQNHNINARGWFRQDPYGKYKLHPSTSPSRSRQDRKSVV